MLEMIEFRRGLFTKVLLISLSITTSIAQRANDSKKIDTSTCGLRKGCWYMPPNCGNSTTSADSVQCNSLVTWRSEQVDNGQRALVIELEAETKDILEQHMGKYVAVGVSDDQKMGDDLVLECVASPSGFVRSYVSYNDGKANIRLREASRQLLRNSSGSMDDGRLTCRMTMLLDWSQNSSSLLAAESWALFDPTDAAYTLLFAKGNADPETMALTIHWMRDGELFPWVSKQRVRLESDRIQLREAKHYDIPRSIQYSLVQVHGVFMVFGWWFFAAVSILIARFFKPMWPESTMCGTAVWFQLHRLLMIVSLVLQCVAFALVFIQAGEFFTCYKTCSESQYALMLHTYMGVACTAAALIQPFMAWFRPAPTSNKRPIFNWLHWFVGTGGFLIATITICLTPTLGKSGLRRLFGFKTDYVKAGYISSFIICSILFQILLYCGFGSDVKAPIPMVGLDGPQKPAPKNKASQPKLNVGRILVLAFFILSAASLCSALTYMIVSNRH